MTDEQPHWFRPIGALLLMLTSPTMVFGLWWACTQENGSLTTFLNLFLEKGIWGGLSEIWIWPNLVAWQIIGSWALFQLILMLIVPGKQYIGPTTPKGEKPVYKANGVQCFFITQIIVIYVVFYTDYIPKSVVYDNLGPMFGALNIWSLLYCTFLYFKGIYFPSSRDHGTTGNVVFDFFWGTELFPRIFDVDLKMFCNCRFAMMGWSALLLMYVAKQQDLYGEPTNALLVSVGIQMVYIFKFFVWETGYLASLDIMHDRFGYYICWGCHVWLPCIYTCHSMYMVTHPVEWSIAGALAVFVCGCYCVWANYEADTQRRVVRDSDGKCEIWGKKPEIIRAKYTTADGKTHSSILLCSGWWAVSRHFHYVPEIMASFFWTLPAWFNSSSPYFYVVYLTILLCDRARRDDWRCEAKYGRYWHQYRERVPYLIIPGVY